MSVEEFENAAAALIYIKHPLPEFDGKGRADALLDALVEADPSFEDPRPLLQVGGQAPPKPDEDPTGGRRRKRTYRRRGKRTYRHSAGSK